MLPELKVYKINYDFIIKNYLDTNLWEKVWTLFIYKDFVVTLNLYEIKTKDSVIVFEIQEKNTYRAEYINYNIKNTSLDILIKQINGAIFRLIERNEESSIKALSKYKELQYLMYDERSKLRDIASDFLDNNGISSEYIREAYIDAYVTDNETIWDKLQSFIAFNKYLVKTDLYLIFCNITHDDVRLNTIVKANSGNPSRLHCIEVDIEEFINNFNTNEYDEDLKNKLEAI